MYLTGGRQHIWVVGWLNQQLTIKKKLSSHGQKWKTEKCVKGLKKKHNHVKANFVEKEMKMFPQKWFRRGNAGVGHVGGVGNIMALIGNKFR